MSKMMKTAALSIFFVFSFSLTGFCEEVKSDLNLKELLSGKTVAGKVLKKQDSFIRTFNSDGTWVSSNPDERRGVDHGFWRVNSSGQLCSNGIDIPEKCSTVIKEGKTFSQIITKRDKIITVATWEILDSASEEFAVHYQKKAFAAMPAAGSSR